MLTLLLKNCHQEILEFAEGDLLVLVVFEKVGRFYSLDRSTQLLLGNLSIFVLVQLLKELDQLMLVKLFTGQTCSCHVFMKLQIVASFLVGQLEYFAHSFNGRIVIDFEGILQSFDKLIEVNLSIFVFV